MNRFDVKYMSLVEEKLSAVINKDSTVTAAAEALSVTRQTIYTWKERYQRFGIEGLIKPRKKRTDRPHNKTPEEIEQLVINTAGEYWKDGVEALSDHLQRLYNLTINPTTVYRILKREGIRYSEHHPRTTKRWKKQLFAHHIPGTELQMDTKYPFGYKQGRVIYTIIDDASRWVYAWTYISATKENTIDFIKRVQKHTPFYMHKIRTDQGREFRNYLVREYLANQGIEHRLNTPYCPGNGVRYLFPGNGVRYLFHKEYCLSKFFKCDIITPMSDERELFKGTAHYYAKYRFGYPKEFFDYVIGFFDLHAQS